MTTPDNEQIRSTVRQTYEKIAQDAQAGCGCGCGPDSATTAEDISMGLGYSENDVSAVPDGANLGLGCGNPQAIAAMKAGETVLDLGSGAGLDCFLASAAVGEHGRVIGVDMTPEMVSKARTNALGQFDNVDFRLGEIEHIPAPDNSVDVIISNCVINLSPEKPSVFAEAFRVLKPGGRIAVTDVVATGELPDDVKNDLELHAGCAAGASPIPQLRDMLEQAGFSHINIETIEASRDGIRAFFGDRLGDLLVSAHIQATKPCNI